MKTLRLIFAGLLLLVVLLLIFQNLALAELRFLGWNIAAPIALPAVLAYLLGALTGRPLFRFFNRERKELHRDAKVRRDVRDRVEYRDRRAA